MQKSFMLVACHQVLPLSHHSSKVRPATHPPPPSSQVHQARETSVLPNQCPGCGSTPALNSPSLCVERDPDSG